MRIISRGEGEGGYNEDNYSWKGRERGRFLNFLLKRFSLDLKNRRKLDLIATIFKIWTWIPLESTHSFLFVHRINLLFQYINLACLSVCVFVSKKMSKRLNRPSPNFVWELTWPQGRVYELSKYLKFCFFCKILKICFCFIQREDARR